MILFLNFRADCLMTGRNFKDYFITNRMIWVTNKIHSLVKQTFSMLTAQVKKLLIQMCKKNSCKLYFF